MTTDVDRKAEEAEFHDARERDRKVMSREDFERKYANKKWYAIAAQSREFVDDWLKENCKGRVALDFGCGLGEMSLKLAENGATVYSIDVSDESVQTTIDRLKRAGLGDRITGQVMDGEAMTFPDAMFDVIICSGVLHHVDVNRVFPELARVMKPTGTLVAMEALGYNPIIRLYRKLTPSLRTAWETDHILTTRELKIADSFFGDRRVHFFYLFSILAVPFRDTAIFRPLLATLRGLDSVILKIPGVRLMAWQMIFFLRKPKRPPTA